MKKRVYLAGPMSGIAEFNFPAFHDAAADLRSKGYEVFSPAEHVDRLYGQDFSRTNLTGDEATAARKYGFSRRLALSLDVDWIFAHATAVALLPGWEASKGAKAERAVADAIGLEIIEL